MPIRKGRVIIMAEIKKMTKKDYFNELKGLVANRQDLVDFIDHEIELLSKKSSRTAPTKTQVENEKIKEDVTIMQKRLDVIVAVAGNELENRKEELEERLDSLREKIKVSPSEYLDSVKEEINEIAMRYRIQKEKREHLLTIRDFYKRNMILNNPLSSKRFKDALEEIKRKVK